MEPRALELSVVCATWNGIELVRPMLDSLLPQLDGAAAEVIFVDNGSTDGVLDYLRTRTDLRLVENGINVGYAVALNRGAAVARGRRILFCNPDIEFRPGAIRAMLDALDADPALGAVNPLIELPGDPPRLCALLATDPGMYYGWNYFSGLMTRFSENRLLNANLEHRPDVRRSDLPWLHGCCLMCSRAALEAAGGWDERYFLYFEDADFGRTLRERGFRLKIVPEARVLHKEGQSGTQVSRKCRMYFLESWHRYQRKHRGRTYRSLAFAVVAGALLLQVAVQGVKLLARRRNSFDAACTCLAAHLAMPFRRLEAERAAELREVHEKLRRRAGAGA